MSETATVSTAAPASTPAAPATFLSSPGAPPSSPDPSTPAGQPRIFGGHVNDSGAFTEGWTEHLRTAGYETLAGKLQLAKDEAGALKMLEDTVRLASRRELKGAPNEAWNEHEVAEFRRAHGVPDSAEGYELKPQTLPEGIEWKDDSAKQYAELLHKHHVPKAAAAELVAMHLQELSGQAQHAKGVFTEGIAELAQKSESHFRKEWGPDYDTRLEANRQFVQSRMSEEELSNPALQAALSHPKIVAIVDDARRALREGSLPGAGQGAALGSQNPQQQAEAIMQQNPNWMRDSALSARVFQLQALQAQQNKRR